MCNLLAASVAKSPYFFAESMFGFPVHCQLVSVKKQTVKMRALITKQKLLFFKLNLKGNLMLSDYVAL